MGPVERQQETQLPSAPVTQARRPVTESGRLRATGRPCSVTTIVPPLLTSRTHSLSFDFSSRIPIRRSAIFSPVQQKRLHYNRCNHIVLIARDTSIAHIRLNRER
jgi:hypothetical protein